jgi:hypothetical protein
MSAAIFGFGSLAVAFVAATVAIWQGYLLRKALHHSRRSTDADLHFRVHSVMQELDKFFIDRPELRPYFYENKRLPRRKRDLDQLDSTAEMIADIAESIVATGGGLGSGQSIGLSIFRFPFPAAISGRVGRPGLTPYPSPSTTPANERIVPRTAPLKVLPGGLLGIKALAVTQIARRSGLGGADGS